MLDPRGGFDPWTLGRLQQQKAQDDRRLLAEAARQSQGPLEDVKRRLDQVYRELDHTEQVQLLLQLQSTLDGHVDESRAGSRESRRQTIFWGVVGVVLALGIWILGSIVSPVNLWHLLFH